MYAAWNADFCCISESPVTPTQGHWEHWSFVGSAWQQINKPERLMYLKNAYRVLLTRARQGMVTVVPEGDSGDKTRNPEWYDEAWEYLRGIGLTA